MKFSVIIPTLWKSDKIYNLLNNLNNVESVGEIILIDNNKQFHNNFKESLSKLLLIQPKENLYVNPSWNLGIKVSNNDLICVCNDDIDFNTNIFQYILENKETLGIVGQCEENYKNDFSDPYELEETNTRFWGWGCLFFINKKDWIEIPDQLKIWCGDDFIFHKNNTKKYIIKNFSIKTNMSTSSDSQEFESVRNNDMEEYKKI